MRILYVNNDGGGFADYIEVEDGINISTFFQNNMEGRKPEDYRIRVNRQSAPSGHVLQDGDRVTITPTKIEGAVAA